MKIVFVDRDGVINKNRPDYVKSWPEFEFLPGSLKALNLLSRNGYKIIVVTNQSVINRKLLTEAELQEIHEKMTRAVLESGARIEAIYHCPHVPEDQCDCRKPEPGLLRRAERDYGLKLSQTCLIGDSFKDVLCARLAGCGKVILVRTGHGGEAEPRCWEAGIHPDFVAEDLTEAAMWLVRQAL